MHFQLDRDQIAGLLLASLALTRRSSNRSRYMSFRLPRPTTRFVGERELLIPSISTDSICAINNKANFVDKEAEFGIAKD